MKYLMNFKNGKIQAELIISITNYFSVILLVLH